jgi:hypothetical protein
LAVPTLTERGCEALGLGERTDGACELPEILCAVDELSELRNVRVLADLSSQFVEYIEGCLLSDLEGPLSNLLHCPLETRSDGGSHV